MGRNGFSSIQNLDELINAGFSDEQARAILGMMSQDAASKQDLELAKLEIKRDIEKNRADLELKIEKVRSDIKELNRKIDENIKNMGYRFTIQVGALFASFTGIMLGGILMMAKFGLLSIQ